MEKIFKACDIRGIYGTEFGEAEAGAIARAVGTIIGDGMIVVGADVRTSSIPLKEEVVCGLVDSGIRVVDLGVISTPEFYFAKNLLGASGGLMITASHNPARFNGMKIVLGDLPITEDQLQEVRRIAEGGLFADGRGSVEGFDVFPDYRGFILEAGKTLLGENNRPRVAVDCGNGCMSDVAPDLLRRLGFEVVEVFCTPDGSFPNREPDSAVPGNLTSLSQAVRLNSADFGAAFDGDGDRVAFTDENGVVIPSDRAMALLTEALLVDHGNESVVYDIKSSRILPETILKLGGRPIMEKSGHTFLKTRMIVENALFGGEVSGHYFYRALGGGDDGLYSTLIMAAIVSQNDSPISQRLATIPTYAITPDIRIPHDGDPSVLDRIAAAFPADRVSRLDGVRVAFDGGWGLARMSVTEPVITLRFEATDPPRLAEIIQKFLAPAPELADKVRQLGLTAWPE